MNSQNNIGYYIYSIITIILFVGLLGFLAYLAYDIVVKLGTAQFTNEDIIHSIILLVGTIIGGNILSKKIEYSHSRKLEVFKEQKELAIRIIDLVEIIRRNNDQEQAEQAISLLRNENLGKQL